jgi:hypothetical protein
MKILLSSVSVAFLLSLQLISPAFTQQRPAEFDESNRLVLLGIKAFRAGKMDVAEANYKQALAALEPLNGPKTDLARMGILKNLHLIYDQQGKKELAKEQIAEITTIEKRCGLPISHKVIEETAPVKPATELKAETSPAKVQKKPAR